MKVRVVLIGHFIDRFGFKERELELPSPCQFRDVAAALKLRKIPHVAAKDGVGIRPSQLLADGDRVIIAPVFSGG
ncbi:MAG: hypothetical protein A2X36_07820 [Elusimicrobia bacterium GWA2_69_24]|nr:MAG: hypothetical protein A2X36_07820 [Elusimicrobia bacterium GWA2_69_24]